MTREQVIDQAVRAVDVPAYWREWLKGFQLRHGMKATALEPSRCANCASKAGMVCREFSRIDHCKQNALGSTETPR